MAQNIESSMHSNIQYRSGFIEIWFIFKNCGKVFDKSDFIQQSLKFVLEDIFSELNCKDFSAALYFHSADL
jgi:hypothetical protein